MHHDFLEVDLVLTQGIFCFFLFIWLYLQILINFKPVYKGIRCLSYANKNSTVNNGVIKLVFSYKHLNLKLRVSLTGYTVTMVTCYIMAMTIICSPTTGHLFDIIIVA